MNLPAADQDFLRDLVKVSRQRARHVRWVDRDGSARITTLNEADATRLNTLARQLGVGSDVVLREAAHLPAAKRPTRMEALDHGRERRPPDLPLRAGPAPSDP